MPFDFTNDFLNNPALQYGLSLLGSRGQINPYQGAQQAMQNMAAAQQLAQLNQFKTMEQGALAGQHIEETRKLKQVNNLLAEAIRQYQGGQDQQAPANFFSAPTPQQEQGPEGTPGVPNGYNGQGQSLNPYNGFATPGTQQIGARPIQQQAASQAGGNQVMPALDPLAFAMSLGGLNEAAKLRQEAYGQKTGPTGIVYGHTANGGIAPVPGSLETLQQFERMKNIEGARIGSAELTMSNGQKVNLSPQQLAIFHETGQLPTWVTDKYGGVQPASVAPSAAPATQPSSVQPAGQAYKQGNNNFGNLRPVGASTGFQSFATPEEGLAALDKNLQSYGNRGVNTITSIVNRWAPSSENNTAAYIADVAKRTGIDPNKQLDMSNPVTRHLLSAAMMVHEGNPSLKQVYAAQNPPTPAPSQAAVTPGVTPSPAEAASANEFALNSAKQYMTLQNNAKVAQTDIANMQLTKAYLGKIGNTGMMAPAELSFYKLAQGMGFQIPPKASYMESVQALTRQFAMKLRNPAEGGGLPGQMSNYEDRLLQSMAPNIDKLPNANSIIANAYIKQKQRTIDQAKLASNWKAQGVPLDEIDQRLIKYADEHPFFSKEDEAAINKAASNTPAFTVKGATPVPSQMGGGQIKNMPGGVKFLGFE